MRLHSIHLALLATLVGLFVPSTRAQSTGPSSSPGCAAEAVPEYVSAYRPHFYDNGVDFRACDDSNLPYKLRKAVTFLARLPTDFVGHQTPWGGHLTVRSPYQFLIDRIAKIYIADPDDDECEGGVGAHFDPARPDRFFVCRHMGSVSTIEMANVLLHEAAHKNGVEHSECPQGYFKDQGFQCDQNIAQGGSYGTTLEFDAGLAHLTTLSLAERREARALMIFTALNNFVEPPLPAREGLVLQRESGETDFYDGQTLTPILTELDPKFVLQTSTYAIRFINAQDNESLTHDNFHYDAGILKSHFFAPTQNAPDYLTEVRDELESCSVFKTVIFCRDLKTLHLRAILAGSGNRFTAAISLRTSWVKPAVDHHQAIYVRRLNIQSGVQSVWQLNSEARHDPLADRLLEANAEGTRIGLTYINMIEAPASFDLKQKRFALDQSGRLQVGPTDSEDWRAAPGTEGVRFKQMMGPFIWSSQLESL